MNALELILKILMYALPGIAVSFLIKQLNHSAKQELSILANEKIQLKMNKLYSIVGWMCIIIMVFFWGIGIYYQETNIYLLCFLATLFWGGLGIPCLAYYKNHWLTFDDNMIFVSSWKAKVETIKWEDISQISFNPTSGYLIISDGNVNVKISSHLVGLKTFVNFIEKKTKWKAKELRLFTS